MTQVIIKRSVTTVLTFAGIPVKETREALVAAGFQFDGRSGQWYRGHKQSIVVDESSVAKEIAS